MTTLLGWGLALCALAIAVAGLLGWGQRRWAGEMQTLRARLEAARLDGRGDRSAAGAAPPARYDARELDGLPAPVQRYFRAVLTDGQPLITAVTIELTGTFNLSPTGEQWKPFSSRQRVTTRRPGFVWDARIAMAPGVTVHVVDSYIAGKGLLHAAVLGLIPMAEQQGDGEIARGEFMRWAAEVPWYPTALLPSQGVRWAAVDDHSARAAFDDGPLSLTLLFRFNDAGLVEGFRAEARGSLVNKQMVMAPWEGRWSNYQTRDGMQLPFTGEVAWMRPEGRKAYFVGTVSALSFEFAA